MPGDPEALSDRNREEGRGWGFGGRELGPLVPPPECPGLRPPEGAASDGVHAGHKRSTTRATARFLPTANPEEPENHVIGNAMRLIRVSQLADQRQQPEMKEINRI